MKLEVIRCIADELNDPTYGVNAVLPTIPRDSGDEQPPQIYAVYDETRHGWLARGELPKEMKDSAKNPFLVVMMLGDLSYGGRSRPTSEQTKVVRADFQVTVQYVTNASLTQRGEQDGIYTGRAIRGVLNRLFSPDRASARQRNGVQLEVLKDITALNVFETVEDNTIIGSIVVLNGTAHETSL